MTWLQILLLAALQGIAEFLPISSSGHLVIAEALWGIDKGVVEVNIILHAGTLLSILAFYWRRVWRLLGEDRRVVLALVVGTIPAVAVGLPLRKYGEHLLESPLLAGCMLPLTGLMLLWASRRREGEMEYPRMSFAGAFLIGLFQAVAILPGISRSGATISGGLAIGLKRSSAATFAFLLALPVIAGATVLELRKAFDGSEAGWSTAPPLLAMGATVSFVVGLASLWGLVRLVEHGRLHWFAWWCIPLGLAVVVWQLSL